MRAQWRGQAAIAAVTLLVMAIATLLPFNSPMAPNPLVTPASQALNAVVKLLWLAAVLVARARQPNGRLWKLMLAYVLVSEVWAFGYFPNPYTFAVSGFFARLDLAILAHVLLAFPSGHLQNRLERSIAVATYVLILGAAVVNALVWVPQWEPASCGFCPPNVFLVWPNNDLNDFVGRAVRLVSPVVGALVLSAIWRRWRAAGPAGRRALLPVLLALPLAIVVPVLNLGKVFGNEILLLGRLPIYDVVLAMLPIALLIGVLRVRLDRGRVASLLVELRRGVPIDGLRGALARALGDPTLQLAFAAPTPGGYIDAEGRPVELSLDDEARAVSRIERDGELLAVIVHDRALDEEDPGLVEAVGAAAGFAIDTERLTAQVRAQLEEVRASRARIVEAADDARRKVERDLHDGAQQRLIALTMRLQVAREGSAAAAALIDETTAELQAAIREVRDLARGLHPPILDEAGLGAALETLAERCSIPVTLQAPEERYPRAVETAAYYVVSEALTNAVRYSKATHVTISVSQAGGMLHVSVSDDGRGGADPEHGSGIGGLMDRVAAVGGRLTLTSPVGGGTILATALPLVGEDGPV